jgi:glycosyltransferase involved in cell wall biosynthesis
MNKGKISIIVPIYNSGKFVTRCIESILNQTYVNFELILVDDGSTDQSHSICKEYECNDHRIRVFQQENSGASEARNLGLEKITGEYLMFVDSDDYIEPNMLEVLIKTADQESADFVMCGLVVDIYDKEGRIESSVHHTPSHRVIKGNSNIPKNIIDLVESEKISGPCCKLIKTKIIKNNNIKMPPHIALQEDLYFNIEVLGYVNKICVIPDSLYHYNQGVGETVTTRYYANRYEMTNEVHNYLVNYYKERCNESDILGKIMYIYIKNTYAALMSMFHQNCNLLFSEKIGMINDIIDSEKFKNMMKMADRKGYKYKLLKIILKSKNRILIYYVSKFLYLLKNKFGLKY